MRRVRVGGSNCLKGDSASHSSSLATGVELKSLYTRSLSACFRQRGRSDCVAGRPSRGAHGEDAMKSIAVLLPSWILWSALSVSRAGGRRVPAHGGGDASGGDENAEREKKKLNFRGDAAAAAAAAANEDDRRLESLLKSVLVSSDTSASASASSDWSGSRLEAQTDVASIEKWNAPYFEDALDGVNVTSQFGNDVILHCRVHNLSDKVVSWLRRAEDGMRLLSYDRQVYISDGRYQLEFREPNDWQLRIRYANERDQGHYECQVSSHPPLVSRVYLKIQVPELQIADERELPIRNKFYGVGSTIELKCLITNVAHHPDAFVTWKHGTRTLNYDTVRGGINVKTEILADGAQSKLFVANAKTADSGNYTCSLADVAATYVTVQVLNGETPAAMQRGGSSDHAKFHRLIIFLLVARIVDQYRSSVDDHTLAQRSAAGRNRNANSDSRVKWKRSSLVVRHEDGTERRGTTGEYRNIVARESRPPIAHHHHRETDTPAVTLQGKGDVSKQAVTEKNEFNIRR
ncbi:hypothetical protein V9T40_007908 [Parthenolecanium corni]|uniref:Ig-like domain-containing protein n=1 Tax=Parthenolecanium corni TaxID=536013 RepID=A0AAN9TNC5_9HEMI